jgi:hypothetical protein
MTRRLVLLSVFFFVLSALHGQSPADPVSLLDGAVKALVAEINRKISGIPAGESRKVGLDQWIWYDSVPALGSYWAAQLAGELTNIPGRLSTVPFMSETTKIFFCSCRPKTVC